MKIGIYYGGRGEIEDPTLYVIDVIERVLEDLNVKWELYNIYDQKNEVAQLPSTLRDLDGLILATTVEWLGIGGYMTSFLDALWLYGDREKMATLYMQPVVISTTYGEREGMLTLENAWESLGGKPVSGICGYVEDVQQFRQNEAYRKYIEKRVEDMYRSMRDHLSGLPKSSQVVSKSVGRTRQMILTPQESEQLSEFVSDEDKVRRQKVNVKELSKIYSQMIGEEVKEEEPFIADFERVFVPKADLSAAFVFHIEERPLPLVVLADNGELTCRYEERGDADIVATLKAEVLEAIIVGRMTFQRAFSVGNMSVRGSFAMLRRLDELFPFS